MENTDYMRGFIGQICHELLNQKTKNGFARHGNHTCGLCYYV